MDTTLANIVASPKPNLHLTSGWSPVPLTPKPSVPARLRGQRGQEVLSATEWTTVARALRISPRELEIVQGVFDDLKEAAIAGRLGISSHTVHTHLERLYRKLGVSGRNTLIVVVFAELLRIIRTNGELV